MPRVSKDCAPCTCKGRVEKRKSNQEYDINPKEEINSFLVLHLLLPLVALLCIILGSLICSIGFYIRDQKEGHELMR